MAYDTDFYRWTAETASLLRERRFSEVELEAVIEEIESLGRREKHEVYNRVLRIVELMLKLDLATGQLLDYNRRGWLGSVERQRAELERVFEDSPSLRAQLTGELVAKAYRDAARIVAVEYDLVPPGDCPFTVCSVLEGHQGQKQ